MTDVPAGRRPERLDAPGARPRPERRRHRRVVAPPTNPRADGADDVDDAPPAAPPDQAAAGGEGTGDDARDAWIRAQRPPHWD